MQLWNRIWQLKIALEGKEPKIYQKLTPEQDDLHIAFKTEAAMSGIPPSGDITITGLPLDDIEFLATNYYPESGALKPSQVELQAGYQDSLSIVLFGNIYQSVPNFTSADYSISMKVMNGLAQNQLNAYATLSMKGRVTLRDIFANLAKQLNKSLNIHMSVTNRAISDFSFQGSPQELQDSLRSYYPDLDIFTDNNTLHVRPKDSTPKIKYMISPSSGLIGTPQPTPQGCNITTLLLSNLNVGDFIELKSHKLHRLDGIYTIIKLSHQGSSREDAYTSSISLMRRT